MSVEADYDLKLELEIAVGLTMPTLSEEKVKEAQEAVLTTIRKYWYRINFYGFNSTEFLYAQGSTVSSPRSALPKVAHRALCSTSYSTWIPSKGSQL